MEEEVVVDPESPADVSYATQVSLAVFERASVGDLVLVGDDQEIPEGWLVADGQHLRANEYPEFVAAMKIRGLSFALPQERRVRAGLRYAIKVGMRTPVKPLPGMVALAKVESQ